MLLKTNRSLLYCFWCAFLAATVLCTIILTPALAQEGMAEEQRKEREELDSMREEVGDIKNTINDTMRQLTELNNQMKNQTYKEAHLFVRESTVKVASDVQIAALTYNGKLPGPELRFVQGDKVRLVVHNELKYPTSLHLHGMIVKGTVDGLPRPDSGMVKPGSTYAFQFIANQPGTFWYHPQVIHGDQKAKGLCGALIIEPKEQSRSDNPDKEVVLVLSDLKAEYKGRSSELKTSSGVTGKSAGEAKALPAPKPSAAAAASAALSKSDAASDAVSPSSGRLFSAVAVADKKQDATHFFMINGKSAPLAPPIDVRTGQRVKLRVINAGQTAIPLHLSGHRFEVLARDGSDLLEPRVYRDTVTVNPGERMDLEFMAENPGLWALASEVFEQSSREGKTPGGIACIVRYTDMVDKPGEGGK
jgi:FtsP/CotA-like multicopper oxidase with cupredoxin domain